MNKPASLQDAVVKGLITQAQADEFRRLVESGDIIGLLLNAEMTTADLLADLALLNRAYDLACEEVTCVDESNCPGCPKNNPLDFPKGCNVPRERYWKCWRDHFMMLAEKA